MVLTGCETHCNPALVSRCSYFSTVVWMHVLCCLTWLWNKHNVCSNNCWSCETRWERGLSPSCVDAKLNSSCLSLLTQPCTFLTSHMNVNWDCAIISKMVIYSSVFIYRLIRFRSAFQGGRKKQQRSRQRQQAPPQCEQRIKTTWRSKLRRFSFHCFLYLDFKSLTHYFLHSV